MAKKKPKPKPAESQAEHAPPQSCGLYPKLNEEVKAERRKR